MSDGKVKMKFCKISTCCNQPQEDSRYCLIHLALKTGEK
jgi:hypothetical protein